MVIQVNKYIGRREEEDDYFTQRNKMMYKHTMMNGEKHKKVKDKLSQEEMIKKNEEILTPKYEVEDVYGNVEVYDEKPIDVEEQNEQIYNEFSKPYSDGVDLTNFQSESKDTTDEDDIKTY